LDGYWGGEEPARTKLGSWVLYLNRGSALNQKEQGFFRLAVSRPYFSSAMDLASTRLEKPPRKD
jgi:hypothetical protein